MVKSLNLRSRMIFLVQIITAQYVSLNLDVFTFKGNKRHEVELLEIYVAGDAELEVF